MVVDHDTGAATGESIRATLMDRAQESSPDALRALGPAEPAEPGMYAWWVDSEGASHLSEGLGNGLAAGLVYVGQAGAARKNAAPSRNTLRGRLLAMHLGGRARMSTVRRTLAACLREPLGLRTDDDPRLGEWMDRHLSVTAAPVSDRERLRELEPQVIAALDPPLNLAHVTHTPPRKALRGLREAR